MISAKTDEELKANLRERVKSAKQYYGKVELSSNYNGVCALKIIDDPVVRELRARGIDVVLEVKAKFKRCGVIIR